jgi:hypothetical protein
MIDLTSSMVYAQAARLHCFGIQVETFVIAVLLVLSICMNKGDADIVLQDCHCGMEKDV